MACEQHFPASPWAHGHNEEQFREDSAERQHTAHGAPQATKFYIKRFQKQQKKTLT